MELTDVSHRRPRTSRILNTELPDTRQHEATQPGELQLLPILQLLGHHKVHSFFVEQSRQWNSERDPLGTGASFAVEGAPLNISTALDHLRYRSIDTAGVQSGAHFRDHTETRWAYNTEVAFKSSSRRATRVAEILVELRVLCHPPLQKHSNIVRLLGITWTKDQPREISELGEVLMEWPLVAIERAPHGSLREFLGSGVYNRVRTSLRAKLRLCVDVLNGIAALHSSGIVHSDIKVDNALVFKDDPGIAESWRVKLCDFGYAILSSRESVNHQVLGDRLYQAPELDAHSTTLSNQPLPSLDVWSWGMLVWQVMIDGKPYEYRGETLDENLMYQYRAENRVSAIASYSCSQWLNREHPQEGGVAQAVIDTLRRVLVPDPLLRPKAVKILKRLQGLLSDNGSPSLRSTRVDELEDLPFFNLEDHYYDLISFSTVPPRVVHELEFLCRATLGDNLLEAQLQLGLCHSVGFGTGQDTIKASDLICTAARGGHLKAQAVSYRLLTALGVNISDRALSKHWLIQGAESGSRVATVDLKQFFPDEYHAFLERKTKQMDLRQLQKENGPGWPGLLLAVRSGSLNPVLHILEQGVDVDSIGVHGETALHWSTWLEEESSIPIAEALLSKGASIHISSTKQCPMSSDKHFVNEMPPFTTPVDWAIINDNARVLQTLLCTNNNHESYSSLSGFHPLACAARYQSIKCLKLLCILFPRLVNTFDQYGYSTFYYAVRADILEHMLRFVPETEDITATNSCLPFVHKERRVVEILLEADSNMQVDIRRNFNCLHLATIGCDFQVFELLLHSPRWDQFVNEKSVLGWTPIKDAITEGNHAAFISLLERGADPNESWPRTKLHALHLLAIYAKGRFLDMAKALLLRDRDCVMHDRNSKKWTPLHTAAAYGCTEMIDWLIDNGASLEADAIFTHHCSRPGRNLLLRQAEHRVTPLGLAARYKTVAGVHKLCMKHQDLEVPLTAITPSFGGKRMSALYCHLAPGFDSRSYELYVGIEICVGCYKEPFTDFDRSILAILLGYYQPKRPFYLRYSTDFVDHLYDSGLCWAVGTANIEAVQMICGSDKFKPPWKMLIDLAHRQRELTHEHEINKKERLELINYLRDVQISDFDETKSMRLNNRGAKWLLSVTWKIYYGIYGNVEQKQFRRCNDWRLEYCPLNLPMLFEFYHLSSQLLNHRLWPLGHKLPYHKVTCVVTVVFLIPLTVFLVLLAKSVLQVPSVKGINSYVGVKFYVEGVNLYWTVFLFVLIIFNTFWSQTMRGISIFYESRMEHFPGRSKRLVLLQGITILLAAGCGAFNMWIVAPSDFPGPRYRLIRSGADALDWLFEPALILNFDKLCNCLTAWLFFTQVLPPFIALIYFCKRAVTYLYRSPPKSSECVIIDPLSITRPRLGASPFEASGE